jgi:hypothetical protein
MDLTTSPHGTLNGELTNINLVVKEPVPNQSILENGTQAGTKNGSLHGPLVTGDGTNTNGQSMTRNASLVACVKEAVLLNTRLKRLPKSTEK